MKLTLLTNQPIEGAERSSCSAAQGDNDLLVR